MSQNKESYAEDAGYYEALRIKQQAEHEAMIKAEAQEYGVSVEDYERGHSMLIDMGTRHDHQKKQRDAEIEAERQRHKKHMDKSVIQSANIPTLISAIVSKAPVQLAGDKLQYSKTGHLPESLKAWVISQFDGVKQ